MRDYLSLGGYPILLCERTQVQVYLAISLRNAVYNSIRAASVPNRAFLKLTIRHCFTINRAFLFFSRAFPKTIIYRHSTINRVLPVPGRVFFFETIDLPLCDFGNHIDLATVATILILPPCNFDKGIDLANTCRNLLLQLRAVTCYTFNLNFKLLLQG